MGLSITGGVTMTNGVTLGAGGGGGGADPYFANVVLLVHGDGANGGTTFTDSSSYNRTPSSISNVTTSNEQTLFGQNTIKSINLGPDFGGSSLGYASSLDFAITGTYTLEFQLYIPSSFSQPFFMARSGQSYMVIDSGSKTLTLNQYPGVPSGLLTANSWNYVAYSINSGNDSLYINGTRVGQTSASSIAGAQPFNLLGVPTRGDLTALGGYLAEVRYTQGVARYSGETIPVQTAPWPNS